MAAFDPAGTVRVLNQHGVRFVVICGIAAHADDLGLLATIDIDVTPPGTAGTPNALRQRLVLLPQCSHTNGHDQCYGMAGEASGGYRVKYRDPTGRQ